MISNEELKEYLLKNRVNEKGVLDLSDLDFSDFCGDVDISHMTVAKNLNQSHQIVPRSLNQQSQNVGNTLFQNHQHVRRMLCQDRQYVDGVLISYKLRKNESWEAKDKYVLRMKGETKND